MSNQVPPILRAWRKVIRDLAKKHSPEDIAETLGFDIQQVRECLDTQDPEAKVG